jgi:hypothetical protein
MRKLDYTLFTNVHFTYHIIQDMFQQIFKYELTSWNIYIIYQIIIFTYLIKYLFSSVQVPNLLKLI